MGETGLEARRPTIPCVCDGCGGRVIKQVSSYFRGRYYFLQPECEQCGATYWGAGDFEAVPVGVAEFEACMRQPFTI